MLWGGHYPLHLVYTKCARVLGISSVVVIGVALQSKGNARLPVHKVDDILRRIEIDDIRPSLRLPCSTLRAYMVEGFITCCPSCDESQNQRPSRTHLDG